MTKSQSAKLTLIGPIDKLSPKEAFTYKATSLDHAFGTMSTLNLGVCLNLCPLIMWNL